MEFVADESEPACTGLLSDPIMSYTYVSPPFWCSVRDSPARKVDFAYHAYEIHWKGDRRYSPDLNDPAVQSTMLPIFHSVERAVVWRTWTPFNFGSYGQIRRSLDATEKYPILKIADNNDSDREMIEAEYAILQSTPCDFMVSVDPEPFTDDDGVFGYKMELLYPLSVDEIREVFQSLSEAVSCLHRAGIVHGDLMPGNIMRNKAGRIKLIDFGCSGKIGDELRAYNPRRKQGLTCYAIDQDQESLQQLQKLRRFL